MSDIPNIAFTVLDAIGHYEKAHHRMPGEVQFSPVDWGRMLKASGYPPSTIKHGLVWGCNARSSDGTQEGRMKLLVRKTTQ